MTGTRKRIWWFSGLAVAVSMAAVVGFWAWYLIDPVPFQYSDGDMATWIWLTRHGEDVYAGLGGLPMRAANHPPLFMRLVALIAPSDDAILRTGGLVAAVGWLSTMAGVYLSLRRTAGAPVAWCGALLAGGSWPVASYAGVCLGDAPALGLGVLGVTLAVWRPAGWPFLAAIAFAASVLCKHSLVVFPAGVIAWAVVRERRAAVVLLVTTAALVGAVLLTFRLVEPLFLWSIAPWSARNFAEKALLWVVPLGFGLSASASALRRSEALGPWPAVWIAALVWTIALGRIGSGSNYVLELSVATAVLAAAAGGRRLAAHAGATAIQVIVWVGWLSLRVVPEMRVEQAAAAEALAGISGTIIAEQTWYATRTGRPPLVLPFLAAQLAASRRWSDAPLRDALARGEVARVLLQFDVTDARPGGHWDRFTPAVVSAIRDRYVLEWARGSLHVYRPSP